jgi:hypothetical protein
MKRSAQIILIMLVTALMSSSAFATISFSDEFESYPVNDGTNMGDLGGGWLLFVNVFANSPDCTPYLYGYGVFPAPNRNDAISNIVVGDTGNAFNVFSDYSNGDHGNNNCIETNLFQERIVSGPDVGSYTYKFDTQAPAALGTDVQVYGFIKLLDPNTFQTYAFESISTETAGEKILEIELGAADVGAILQWGFTNVASNYEASGRLYDNVEFDLSSVVTPGDDPTLAVPVPFWAYLLMAGLLAWLGGTTLLARRKA